MKKKEKQVEQQVTKNYKVTLTNGYNSGQQIVITGGFTENEIKTLNNNVGRDFVFTNPYINSYNLRFFSVIQVEETDQTNKI